MSHFKKKDLTLSVLKPHLKPPSSKLADTLTAHVLNLITFSFYG